MNNCWQTKMTMRRLKLKSPSQFVGLIKRAQSSRAYLDETKRMNFFTAINDGMRVAMQTDPSAIVFGEDVGFGGVFRCSVGLQEGNT